jgi:uncharacterized membrane protein
MQLAPAMPAAARVPAIDLVRGFVIALMALDHVRDFFGFTPFNIEDLAATTPGWFWTRWITHLCATVFVLLAGSSAFLRGQKTGPRALARYLLSRGAMLLLLEATWVSFSWQLGYNVLILQVIWALGVGMMALAGLLWLPRWALATVAALLILPHNLLDDIHSQSAWWLAWHQQGFYALPPGSHLNGIVFMYPLMPWIGLMAAGYAFGPVFTLPAPARQRVLWCASAALLLAFVLLRAANFYGDPDPWSPQHHGLMADAMSFMRVHKYPPSLQYLLVTGGIGMALLAACARLPARGPLLLFGRHPLFFYLVHVALIHALGNLYFTVRFGAAPSFGPAGAVIPPGYAPSLAVVYAAWAGVLVLMYGLCRLWARRGRGPAVTAAPHAA